MFLKVVILKIRFLDKVQKLMLFQVLENIQNKFRGHKESELYLEGLQILTCCKTPKLTQREKSFSVPC